MNRRHFLTSAALAICAPPPDFLDHIHSHVENAILIDLPPVPDLASVAGLTESALDRILATLRPHVESEVYSIYMTRKTFVELRAKLDLPPLVPFSPVEPDSAGSLRDHIAGTAARIPATLLPSTP